MKGMANMNKFIVSLFVFIFTLAFSAVLTAANSTVNSACSSAQFAEELSKTGTSFTEEEPYIYVRVLIEGRWWTYVYAMDGSFIVAIPDEDE